MRLINEYTERFKTPKKTPTVKKNKNDDKVIVIGYTKSGRKIKVQNINKKYYDCYFNEIKIVLWEYDKEYKHEYKCTKNEPPNENTGLFLAIDEFGNEFIAYEKENNYYNYSLDSKVNVLLWREFNKKHLKKYK